MNICFLPTTLVLKIHRSAALLAILLCQSQVSIASDNAVEASVAQVPPSSAVNPFYTGNKPPLLPSPLLKLPIGSISPKSWLRHQLEREAGGMPGHLEEISKWCKSQNSAWASPDGTGHFGWEELPYWLKGYGDLGYVLHDEKIIATARKWIDAVLAS